MKSYDEENGLYKGSIYEDRHYNRYIWEGFINTKFFSGKKKFTGKTNEECLRKLRAFVAQKSVSNDVPIDISLAKWIDVWLERKSNRIRENSLKIYRMHLEYVSRDLGKRPVKDITSQDMQDFFDRLLINGGVNGGALSSSTVNSCRRYTKSCFKSAVKIGLIESNPVDDTECAPENFTRRIFALSTQEVVRLINVAEGGDYLDVGVKNPRFRKKDIGSQYLTKQAALIIKLLFATGMRFMEFCGLTINDLNPDFKFIRICKQLAKSRKTAKIPPIWNPPKTLNSYRNVYISAELVNDILDFLKYQKEMSNYLGDKFQNSYNLIFTGATGGPLNRKNFVETYFNRMVVAAGIDPDMTPHTCRHTYVTLQLMNGLNVKLVADQVGDSVETVLKTYAKVLPEMRSMAAESFEQNILAQTRCNEVNEKDE